MQTSFFEIGGAIRTSSLRPSVHIASPISQNSVRIYRCVLARLTAFHHYCKLFDIENCVDLIADAFQCNDPLKMTDIWHKYWNSFHNEGLFIGFKIENLSFKNIEFQLIFIETFLDALCLKSYSRNRFKFKLRVSSFLTYGLESCSNEIQQQPLYVSNTCFLKGQGIHLKCCHIFNHLSPYSQRSVLLNGLQSTSKFKKVVFT